MTQTERELVSRARAGDTAAFEQLIWIWRRIC